MDLRLRARKKVAVDVFVSWAGQRSLLFRTYDLSSGGAFLASDGLELPKQQSLQLQFVLSDPNSNVIRLRHLSAVVARTDVGGSGLMFVGKTATSNDS